MAAQHPLHVDCETCEVRGLACDDCVVAVLLGDPRATGAPAAPSAADLDLDAGDRVALAVLADGGLVPPLRMTRPRGESRDRDSA